MGSRWKSDGSLMEVGRLWKFGRLQFNPCFFRAGNESVSTFFASVISDLDCAQSARARDPSFSATW
jgi:hypothetical protein